MLAPVHAREVRRLLRDGTATVEARHECAFAYMARVSSRSPRRLFQDPSLFDLRVAFRRSTLRGRRAGATSSRIAVDAVLLRFMLGDATTQELLLDLSRLLGAMRLRRVLLECEAAVTMCCALRHVAG